MSHNHNHSCICAYEQVRYCKHCYTVYCLNCSQEWTTKGSYTWTTPWYGKFTGNQSGSWEIPVTTTTAPTLTSGYIQQLQNTSCKHGE